MANSPQRRAPTSRQSWRGQGQDASPRARKTGRFLFTAGALVLLAWLGWLLLPADLAPRTHIVTVPITDYNALDVPPIPFQQEDLQSYQEVAEVLLRRGWTAKPAHLSELQTAKTLGGSLGGKLKDIVSSPRDILVLHLSGHGVSLDGKAELLCSDFDPVRPDLGHVSLTRVLEQVRDCPAAVKLLLLDSGSLQCDSRIGMIGNDFARLLDETVRGINDPSLWVLASHDQREMPGVSYPLRHSRFGAAVNTALGGAADANGDSQLDLTEFYLFVRGHVSRWNEQADAQRQTPFLLRGGTGRVAAPAEQIVLISSLPPPEAQSTAWLGWPTHLHAAESEPKGAKEEAATQSPAKTDGKSPAEPAADSKSGPAKVADQQPATQQPATEKAAAGSQAAGTAVPPSTNDSAPAKANAPAAGSSEAKASTAGKAPEEPKEGEEEATKLEREVRLVLDEAWTLRDRMQDRSALEWTPLDYAPGLWREYQDLLLGYELRFLAGAAHDRSELADKVRQNLLPLADALTRPASGRPGAGATPAERIAAARQRLEESGIPAAFDGLSLTTKPLRQAWRLRNDLTFRARDYMRWHVQTLATGGDEPLFTDLSQFLTELAEFAEVVERAWPTDSSTADRLPDTLEDLGKRQRSLVRLQAGLDERLSAEIEESARSTGQAKHATRMTALLATALPRSDERRRLRVALFALKDQMPTWEIAAPKVVDAPSGRDAKNWSVLHNQAELEFKFARLAGLASDVELRFAELPATHPAQSSDAVWNQLATFALVLQKFYAAIPAGVAAEEASAAQRQDGGRLEAQRRVERLLRVVDGRDVRRVELSSISPLPVYRELQIAWEAPDQIELKVAEAFKLDAGFRSSGDFPPEAIVSLQFNDALLDITSLDGSVRAKRGAPLDSQFVLREPGRLRLHCLITVRTPLGETLPLDVKVKIGGREESGHVDIVVPGIDRIDVAATGTRGTVQETPRALRLLPFANRETEFKLELVNRSGKARKVSVELLAAPANWNQERSQLEGFTVLTAIPELALPATETPVAVAFPLPATPPVPPAVVPGTPAPPVPPLPRVDRGWVCVIKDATANRRWERWVELAPLPPSSYLEAQAGYDRVQGRITVQLRARDFDNDGTPDFDRLPREGSQLQWETGKEVDAQSAMRVSARLSGDSIAELFAGVPPETGKLVEVQLTVDGYPRAFWFEIDCGKNSSDIRPLRDLRRVRILAPVKDEAFRAPRDELPARLAIDAPADAFRQPEDVLQVGLNVARDRTLRGVPTLKFRSDRQFEMRWAGVGADGALRISSSVHDFEINLDAMGLINTRAEVVAELKLAQNDTIEKDYVTVLLDGSEPVLKAATLPASASVSKGMPLTVSIEGTDLSGVKRVEFAIDLDGSGTMQKPELARLDVRQGRWLFEVDTAALKPGQYRGLIRAVDQVELASKILRVPFTVEPPKPDVAAKKAGGNPNNVIKGNVKLGGKPAGGVKVVLGGVNRRAVTEQDGKFEFRDLPPGAYEVQAEGIVKNRFYKSGSVKVNLEAAPKPPAQVDVDLPF